MRRRTAAIAILIGLVLSSCGGDESAPGASPDAASKTPASTGDSAGPAFDPCTAISDDEIKSIVGYDVTKKDTGNGCIWENLDEPRLPSVFVGAGVPSDLGGGLESSKAGTQSVLNGDAEALSGVGEAAYLVVGTGKDFAKESVQAQGVIEASGQLITVGITQLGESSEAEVDGLARKAMDLVGSRV